MYLHLLTRVGHRAFEHSVSLGMKEEGWFKSRVERLLLQIPNVKQVRTTVLGDIYPLQKPSYQFYLTTKSVQSLLLNSVGL